MPIAGISKFIKPTTRRLIDAAWDDAWRELKKGGLVNAAFARRKLARTIVTLAAAGETDADALKRYALCVTRGALLSEKVARWRGRRSERHPIAALTPTESAAINPEHQSLNRTIREPPDVA